MGTLDDEHAQQIQMTYLVLTAIWTVMLVILGSRTSHPYGLIILLFPYLVFALAYFNIHGSSPEVEERYFAGQVFTVAIFITLPLLVRATDINHGREKYMLPMIMALLFTILSIIDFWVPAWWLSIQQHVQKGLQTMGLTLVVYSLYTFYVETRNVNLRPSTNAR